MNWGLTEPLCRLTHPNLTERRTDNANFPVALSVLLGLTIVCGLLVTGCVAHSMGLPPPGGTRPLVKIGLAAPFEGLDRPLGYEALAGVKLALAERNAAGGVGGYRVELVALNDFGEPEEARLQAREFAVDPAVVGVVTGWTAETARASLSIYQQAGLAVAVPWSVPSELADRESGLVLVAADTQRTVEELAGAIAGTSPKQVLAVVDESSTALYQQSMHARGLEAEVLSLPGVLDCGFFEEWATDSDLDQAQLSKTLVLATDGVRAGQALLALVAHNWDVATFGGAEAGSLHIVSVGGAAANGFTFVSPAPAGRDVTRAEGDSDFDLEGLGPRAVLAYDATHVLLDAIELAVREDGRPSRRGVVATLPRVQRAGLTGVIAFDAAGRRVDAPVWLYQIVDRNYPGQRVVLPQVVGGE